MIPSKDSRALRGSPWRRASMPCARASLGGWCMPIGLLHPANPDRSVAALDRQVEVAEEACRDRDFHRFLRPRLPDIRVVAVQLPPYLAVVENEDGPAARGPAQLEHRRRDLGDLGWRRGFSEILDPRHGLGGGKSKHIDPAGRLLGLWRGRTVCARRSGIEALQTRGGIPDAGASRDLGQQCVSHGVGVRRAGNEDRNESKYADLHGKLTVRAPASPGGRSAASMDGDRSKTNDYILAS